MRKLLKKQGATPTTVMTDKLRSYASALRDLGVVRWHDGGRWKNNRAENSHQPLRQRERRQLLGALPGGFSPRPCRRSGVGVFQLISGQGKDHPLLIHAD